MMTHEDLASVRTVDLTTFGRKTGFARSVEIWWFHVDSRFIITGTPGPRDWLANVRADPRVLIGVQGTRIEATAHEVVDRELRKLVFSQRETRWYATQSEFRQLVEEAPMIEIILNDTTRPAGFDVRRRAELI